MSLTCNVHKGDTPVNIKWFLNGVPVEEISDITISRGGKKVSMLNIDSVQAEHSGNYTCLAQNRAGTSSYSTSLNVNGQKIY